MRNSKTLPVLDPLLDMHQFAALLNSDIRTAARLCASGRVPAKNIASNPLSRKKSWRVRLSDAMRYIETPDNTPLPAVERSMQLPPGVMRYA